MAQVMEVLDARKVAPEEAVPKNRHRALFDYWQSKCQGWELPSRADIDPSEIPAHVLPDISLVTVERYSGEKLRYRFRLIGTNVVLNLGRDLTGFSFDQAFHREDYLASEQFVYGKVVRKAKWQWSRAALRVPGREYITHSRLLLPLASDGRTVNMVLGHSLFEMRQG